ncbi:ornithine cyclodeaminase [Aromatoleum toluolicum]|uniref:Ornithine cyclodeaminase n=1 Tax=Aromatoleum toluolicum TaxID=90060 RepID=A0ABX1ND77_9RHOO|nr:ornithine cyclodeaminase [Aromatoleum toluolicum]NMF97209.1 ornithine cyclodeaminase [Aromatoleum toluolicum]
MKTSNRIPTRFLSAERAAELVAAKGIANCLAGMADYIRADFLRWNEFEKTARVANHSDDGVIELMPISDDALYSFKYVNGHPKNHRFGLSTVMAFGVLADVDTGAPTLVSELTLTTALRTAATSALAARALARPDSKRMALIGNGAQSEFQALAFHHLLGITEFHLFDVDAAATDKLMRNLERMGLSAKRFASTRDAVKGCDIVTTVTADKTNATILTPDMIEPGMHINGVGGDCPGKTELHADVLRMGRVFCEFEPQSRIEGDMQQMPADFAVTELWNVLAGKLPGRQAADEVTVFDSVGFALEDFSALRFMRDLAIELGVEEEISLIPDLADPKNLFGSVPVSAAPRAAVRELQAA